MIRQIQDTLRAMHDCTPRPAMDFIALTDDEYRALLREVAPLCPFPSRPGQDTFGGVPVIFAGSEEHKLRKLMGQVGFCPSESAAEQPRTDAGGEG